MILLLGRRFDSIVSVSVDCCEVHPSKKYLLFFTKIYQKWKWKIQLKMKKKYVRCYFDAVFDAISMRMCVYWVFLKVSVYFWVSSGWTRFLSSVSLFGITGVAIDSRLSVWCSTSCNKWKEKNWWSEFFWCICACLGVILLFLLFDLGVLCSKISYYFFGFRDTSTECLLHHILPPAVENWCCCECRWCFPVQGYTRRSIRDARYMAHM